MSNKFQGAPQNDTVQMGSKHEMICKPPDGFPKPSISWLHNNKPLLAKPYQIDIVNSTDMSVLKFHQVSWEDRGAYICIAKNEEKKRNSEAAYLTVKGTFPFSFRFLFVVFFFY